jgi:hypothetical protein
MTTVDTVFLIITACAISLFFIIGVVLLGLIIALISKIKKLVTQAESLIDTVEDAAFTIKNVGSNASGPLAMLKVINNIVKLVNRK